MAVRSQLSDIFAVGASVDRSLCVDNYAAVLLTFGGKFAENCALFFENDIQPNCCGCCQDEGYGSAKSSSNDPTVNQALWHRSYN